MSHPRPWRRALMLVGISLALGCGGASASSPDAGPPPPPPPPPPANTVKVMNNSFTPGDLTVSAGTTVTWNWDTCSGGDPYGNGGVCVAHSVVLDDGSAASGTQSTGSYTHQFSRAGTYPYHCAIHGAAMSGKVVVQ